MTGLDGLARALLVLAPLASCGDFTDRDFTDREDAGGGATDCPWPIESAVPGGTVELGSDRSGFVPLPDELPFIKGTQNGAFLVVQARITGLEPGDPDVLLAPGNPRTLFSATFFDGTVPEPGCPSRSGYAPSPAAGTFERERAEQLEFIPFAVAVPAFDTVVRIRVEVIDSEGRYASDERDVLCTAPDGWPYEADAGVTIDGGEADASVESDAAP
jgi:hypothetical protein